MVRRYNISLGDTSNLSDNSSKDATPMVDRQCGFESRRTRSTCEGQSMHVKFDDKEPGNKTP